MEVFTLKRLLRWFIPLNFYIKALIWFGGVVVNMFIFLILSEFYYDDFGFLSFDNPWTFYPFALFWIALPFIIIYFITTPFELKEKAISDNDFTTKTLLYQTHIKEKEFNIRFLGYWVHLYDDKGKWLNADDDIPIERYFPYTGAADIYLRSEDFMRYSGREWIVNNTSILIKLNNKTFRKRLKFMDITDIEITPEKMILAVTSKNIDSKSEKANGYEITFDVGGDKMAETIKDRIYRNTGRG